VVSRTDSEWLARGREGGCSELAPSEFELIGEYAMGRYLGDEGAHAAMNERMTSMMGESGAECTPPSAIGTAAAPAGSRPGLSSA
jgi:hypothetical protein